MKYGKTTRLMENVSFFHEYILSVYLLNHALEYGAVKVMCLNIMQGHLPWIKDDKNSKHPRKSTK